MTQRYVPDFDNERFERDRPPAERPSPFFKAVETEQIAHFLWGPLPKCAEAHGYILH